MMTKSYLVCDTEYRECVRELMRKYKKTLDFLGERRCPRCGNEHAKVQSLSQRPILCLQCGWVPDRGGLSYLFDKNHHFEDWELVENETNRLVFVALWLGESRWRFEVQHDSRVGDWIICGIKEDGIGAFQPGGVPTWEDAVAYVLDLMDVCEDSDVRPTEKIT